MFISSRNGFHPLRGLVGSLICFSIVFLTLLLLEVTCLLFIQFTLDHTNKVEVGWFIKTLEVWMLPDFGASFFLAFAGWLAYSTRTEKDMGLVKSIFWLIVTTIAFEVQMEAMGINPIHTSRSRSEPIPPLFIQVLEVTFYPAIATAFLTFVIAFKALWLKKRSTDHAID